MKKNPYSVIQTILVTERSMELAEENKYVFKVDPAANKIDIRRAVEEIYDVKVGSVNTMNRLGKRKRMGRSPKIGRRANWKKAVVTLAEGEISIV
jgi:large subunit ribosomal protein L23